MFEITNENWLTAVSGGDVENLTSSDGGVGGGTDGSGCMAPGASFNNLNDYGLASDTAAVANAMSTPLTSAQSAQATATNQTNAMVAAAAPTVAGAVGGAVQQVGTDCAINAAGNALASAATGSKGNALLVSAAIGCVSGVTTGALFRLTSH